MKKSLRLITAGCLATFLLLVAGFASAQTNMDEFMIKWDHSKQYTLDVLAQMPDAGMDDKPDAEAMSFKEQIHHIANSIAGLSQRFLNGTEPDFAIDIATCSKVELADFVAKSYDYGAKSIKAISPEQAEEKLDVFGNKASRRQVMALLMDHSSHHVGSAVVYLRLQGVKPPAYVGF
jgi:uncharacterized damage-inducible protein DinB